MGKKFSSIPRERQDSRFRTVDDRAATKRDHDVGLGFLQLLFECGDGARGRVLANGCEAVGVAATEKVAHLVEQCRLFRNRAGGDDHGAQAADSLHFTGKLRHTAWSVDHLVYWQKDIRARL